MYGDSEIESAPLGLKADCYEDFAENVYVFRRQFYEGQKRFFAKDEVAIVIHRKNTSSTTEHPTGTMDPNNFFNFHIQSLQSCYR